VPLVARNETTPERNTWLNTVLAYGRFSLMETAIISTNLTDQTQKFFVDHKRLENLFTKTCGVNTVVMVKDLLDSVKAPEYYFLREFISTERYQSLPPFGSSIVLITVCPDDKFVFQNALKSSIMRTKEKLLNGLDISAEQIS